MKALFFGLGGIGQRHLRNLRQLVPDAQIGAVRHGGRVFEVHDDLSVDAGADIVAKYGIETFPDLDAAAGFAPDFAVVANPTSLHVQTARSLVDRGIPVFLEKPIGADGDDVEGLAAAAATQNVPVAVAFQLRRHPCVRKAKEWIDSGRLGRLLSAEARVHAYMPDWHGYEDYRDLYAARHDLGGGVVLTEVHEIDLLDWILGPAQRVSAMGGTLGGLEMDVEDTVSALLEQDGGGHRYPAALTLSFVQRPPTRHLAVYGTDASVTVSIPQDWATLTDAQSGEVERFELTDFARNSMFVETLGGFLDWLGGGPEAETALARCLSGHRTAIAIKRALADGTVRPAGAG